MPSRRTYTDDELGAAVATASSWRGVLRGLGLAATSASAMRSVRGHADRLGLDYAHFTGQRRWTDADLARAVVGSSSWREVMDALALAGGSSQGTLKAHAARLGLDTAHLGRASRHPAPGADEHVSGHASAHRPDLAHLRRAGSLMAAAWFTLCGHEVSWPLEPARYDLVVRTGDRMLRVQVKTTTVRAGASWRVWLSTTGGSRTVYDPDDVDLFFVIDGALRYYLIPVAAVGGLHAITLSGYEAFLVDACAPATA